MGIAQEALTDLLNEPTEGLRRSIVTTAIMTGGFSIWMKVFEQDIDMRWRFIAAFRGTSKDCFDSATQPVSPRPGNGLAHAGKI